MTPYETQLNNIEAVQALGYNVVTCEQCGTVLIVKKGEDTHCTGCDYTDSGDAPDLYY